MCGGVVFGYTDQGEPLNDPQVLSSARASGLQLWKNGIVPFIVGGSANEDDRTTFKSARKYMEKISCIRFVFK